MKDLCRVQSLEINLATFDRKICLARGGLQLSMRSDDDVGRWMMFGFALSRAPVRGRFLLSVRLSGESLTITGPPVRTDIP
jgi:hypothetical protein